MKIKINKFDNGVFILDCINETDEFKVKLICPDPFKYKSIDDSEREVNKSDLEKESIDYLMSNVKLKLIDSIPENLYEVPNYHKFIDSYNLRKTLQEMNLMPVLIYLDGINIYVNIDENKLVMSSDFQFYGVSHPMEKWYLGCIDKMIKNFNLDLGK